MYVSLKWEQLKPDWNNPEELLVFSDWLEEQGKGLAAKGARLIATGDLRPYPFAWSNSGATEYVWSWFWGENGQASLPVNEKTLRLRAAQANLIDLLTWNQFLSLPRALRQPMQSWRDYPSEEAAFQALLEVASKPIREEIP